MRQIGLEPVRTVSSLDVAGGSRGPPLRSPTWRDQLSMFATTEIALGITVRAATRFALMEGVMTGSVLVI